MKEYKNAKKYFMREDREDHIIEFKKLSKYLDKNNITIDIKHVKPE
jgi:hypothetical protein